MHLNVTFFVQGINFFITYKLLTAFFFGPIIQSIKEKKEKKEKLEAGIKQEETYLVTLEKEKHHNLSSFQAHAQKKYPFSHRTYYEEPIEIKATEELVETKKLQEQIIDLLIKKVPDVY